MPRPNARQTAMAAGLLLLGCESSVTERPPDAGGDPIELGVNLPTSGHLGGHGQAFTAAIELAVSEINAAGGVAGRPLVLFARDNGSDPSAAADLTATMATRDGLAVMLGPAASNAVDMALPAIRAGELVTISGSSTSALLADADDDGFLFRNVANNDHQAAVLARYVHELAPSDAAVVAHQQDAHCSRMHQQVTSELIARGGNVVGTVALPDVLSSDAEADAAWANIATQIAASPTQPTVVTCAYLGIAEPLVAAWHRSGTHPDAHWLFTDAVRQPAFAAGLPATVTGIRGAAPTLATGQAADEFVSAYGPGFADFTFEPMFYDAVYLAALGLAAQAQQRPAGPLGGSGLREMLPTVAGPPGSLLRASEWAAAVSAIQTGQPVDYDGASGPCDFDDRGEAPGPYEIWEVVDGGFVQVARFGPDEI